MSNLKRLLCYHIAGYDIDTIWCGLNKFYTNAGNQFRILEDT